MEEKYVWFPENSETFNTDNIHSTVEECIEDAQEDYDNQIDIYADGDEYNSHFINISKIVNFDYKNAFKRWNYSIQDILFGELENFTSDLDSENINISVDLRQGVKEEDMKNEITEALAKIAEKYYSVYPSIASDPDSIITYDLKNKCYD